MAIKPIWIAAAVLAGAIAFVGCKNRKEEPVPSPNAAWTAVTAQSPAPGRHDTVVHHGASGISWFQGTLEEAFSTTCHKCIAMFRR